MKFDELRECSRCGSDACYRQEISKDVLEKVLKVQQLTQEMINNGN